MSLVGTDSSQEGNQKAKEGDRSDSFCSWKRRLRTPSPVDQDSTPAPTGFSAESSKGRKKTPYTYNVGNQDVANRHQVRLGQKGNPSRQPNSHG